MKLQVNGQTRSFEENDATIARLLQQFDLTPLRVAVELNGMLVPRAEYDQTKVHDGDHIEIVTLVGGG